ncbi:hypothetical protein [Azospirillum sp. B4]|uniref:hypothetical protein n=1 Tax=Azospirillum sp. B4 TaxID=95605 RepID=UPI00034AE171|nr:hypothetical protein [Azospirillum sp. B4]
MTDTIPALDHEGFHTWCADWAVRHADDLAPFHMGLVLLSHRAARLFRWQGKTIRAAALDRLTAALRPPSLAESRQWRERRRAALQAFVAGDSAPLLDGPNAGWTVPRHTPRGVWGHPGLYHALWSMVQQREIARRFDRPMGAEPGPALIDLLAAQAARQIGFDRDAAARGRQAAMELGILLMLGGHAQAGAMAAALAVLFDPKSRPAHETLAEALAALDPSDPAAARHAILARYIAPRM